MAPLTPADARAAFESACALYGVDAKEYEKQRFAGGTTIGTIAEVFKRATRGGATDMNAVVSRLWAGAARGTLMSEQDVDAFVF